MELKWLVRLELWDRGLESPVGKEVVQLSLYRGQLETYEVLLKKRTIQNLFGNADQ